MPSQYSTAPPQKQLAPKNAGGSDQSTKFIIGFCVAIPCTLMIVGLHLFVRRRRNKKLGKTGNKDGPKATPTNSAWGKKKSKGSISGRFSEGPNPAEPPPAYKREKELLPTWL
ncbi:hypothetical protein J3458_004374 [Metarhizium acridum]|uniref:uncharacterized protein n=1 Tax=Metarhizium acridum TaxID=92637 RepID=UPI001C6B36C5|nr:hypothetical protein J3458_004374 [Metarhizium acridum]